MKFSFKVWHLCAFCLTCICACIGTIDPVLVVRGIIQDDSVEPERACDVILYDERDNGVIDTDQVMPYTDFIVGFDVPSNIRTFGIGVRCPEVVRQYRSEAFEAGYKDEIDLGQIRLRSQGAK